jgi:hypothetical protein
MPGETASWLWHKDPCNGPGGCFQGPPLCRGVGLGEAAAPAGWRGPRDPVDRLSSTTRAGSVQTDPSPTPVVEGHFWLDRAHFAELTGLTPVDLGSFLLKGRGKMSHYLPRRAT